MGADATVKDSLHDQLATGVQRWCCVLNGPVTGLFIVDTHDRVFVGLHRYTRPGQKRLGTHMVRLRHTIRSQSLRQADRIAESAIRSLEKKRKKFDGDLMVIFGER